MKIVKIKNRKMFNSDNPDGVHYYGMYWNGEFGRYNAVRLTHMSTPDRTRYNQADRGFIKPIKIKELNKYADNGITQFNYIADINGNNLDPSMGVIIKNNVSTYMSRKIKSNIKFNCVNRFKRRVH